MKYRVVRAANSVITFAEEGFESYSKALKFAKRLSEYSEYSAVVDTTPLKSFGPTAKGTLIYWESDSTKRPKKWWR